MYVHPGAAIFFEFKHYKPKKRFTSTKCFAFMEMDEIKPGPIVIELWVDCGVKRLEGCYFASRNTTFIRYLLVFQVQEAHRLQEEETAACNKETTLSPSLSDVTQGQLSGSTLWTWPRLFLTSLTSLWCSASSTPAIREHGWAHWFSLSFGRK